MKKLQEFLENDYKIGVECKARGRGYELTYEGTLSKNTDNFMERIRSTKHGVGDTFQQFIGNILNNKSSFDSLSLAENDKLLKKYMNKGWNIDLFLDGKTLTASAKKMWSDNNKDFKEEIRYGNSSTLLDLMNFMFENYDENDVYVLERKQEFENMKKTLGM